MDINLLCGNLKAKGFIPTYFESEQEAIDYALSLIDCNQTIGSGGSMTIKSLGLLNKLKERGNIIYHTDFFPDTDRKELYRKAGEADFYISSANAITQGGDIVNIDGTANRVSALIYGCKNVMYLVGVNKICTDLDSAIDRIRNIASPLNTRRLNRKTPCAVTGKCSYCNSPDCICNTTVISHHPTTKQENVYVIIINKELGY